MNLQKRIVYGPVLSRRLGRSLGINLLPADMKLCSMNCCYCQYGWTRELLQRDHDSADAFPAVEDILLAVRNVLMKAGDFNYMTFSGNGEPTLHPGFPEIVERIVQMKSYFRSDAKLALLSNSTTCLDAEIKSVIDKIELPMMKLDTGNERMFRRINHAHPSIGFDNVVAGLKSLKRFAIQSMFVQGTIDNSTDDEIDSWIETLKKLNPLWVQIYSLDRHPANKYLKRVEKQRLDQIAARAGQETGIQMEVFS